MKAFRIIGRNIRDAFKGVFRNFSLSLASISCITITLIVVAVSIIMSYNVDNFTNFDEYKAISNTVRHYDLKNVMVCSSYEENYYLRENDIRKINEINKKEAPLIFERNFRITNYDLDYTYILNNSLNRVIECEDINELTYEYLATSNIEYGSEGIIISEVVAREIYRKHSGFNSITDTLDLELI